MANAKRYLQTSAEHTPRTHTERAHMRMQVPVSALALERFRGGTAGCCNCCLGLPYKPDRMLAGRVLLPTLPLPEVVPLGKGLEPCPSAPLPCSLNLGAP